MGREIREPQEAELESALEGPAIYVNKVVATIGNGGVRIEVIMGLDISQESSPAFPCGRHELIRPCSPWCNIRP